MNWKLCLVFLTSVALTFPLFLFIEAWAIRVLCENVLRCN